MNHPFLDAFLKELVEAGADAAELAELAATLPPLEPDGGVRARIMDTLDQGGRLHRFADKVAAELDVDVDRAKELLDRIDDPSVWTKGPAPGCTLFHFKGGPRTAEAITGFVAVEREMSFPHHTHLGDETVVVVQGSVRDCDSGNIAKPGDVVRARKGTSHKLDVMPGPMLIYLAVIFGGVDISGLVLLPGDPRI